MSTETNSRPPETVPWVWFLPGSFSATTVGNIVRSLILKGLSHSAAPATTLSIPRSRSLSLTDHRSYFSWHPVHKVLGGDAHMINPHETQALVVEEITHRMAWPRVSPRPWDTVLMDAQHLLPEDLPCPQDSESGLIFILLPRETTPSMHWRIERLQGTGLGILSARIEALRWVHFSMTQSIELCFSKNVSQEKIKAFSVLLDAKKFVLSPSTGELSFPALIALARTTQKENAVLITETACGWECMLCPPK